MNNPKSNIYKELELHNYYWGGALHIGNINVDLNSKHDIVNILDHTCKYEELRPLNSEWNEINYEQFQHLLISAFQYNLGYPSHQVMSIDKTQHYFKLFTENFNKNKCRCFTNCFGLPWDNENKVHSFNSISEHTIDLALSIIDSNKLLFVYFLFED